MTIQKTLRFQNNITSCKLETNQFHIRNLKQTTTNTKIIKTSIIKTNNNTRKSKFITKSKLDPDNANVLVCGGGGTAMIIARKLKDLGCWVHILQRTDLRAQEIEEMKAAMVKADALDKDGLIKAINSIESIDAVISSVGGTPANPLPDSVGNINIIDAALNKKTKKFILLSSIGTGNSKDAVPQNILDVLRPVLEEKEKAEKRLIECDNQMEYVIIRLGGLKSEEATGNAVLSEDESICGSIMREDAADLAIKCLFSDDCKNKVLSALDKNMVFESKDFQIYNV